MEASHVRIIFSIVCSIDFEHELTKIVCFLLPFKQRNSPLLVCSPTSALCHKATKIDFPLASFLLASANPLSGRL